MENDLKIIVCCHKDDNNIRKDNIYLPIHVGKALSNKDLGFQGDDTGYNISRKNKNYCELTGLYWAWKNLKSKYVGLCHYRRYFNAEESLIRKYLNSYEIILVTPHIMPRTAKEQLFHFCLIEDYCIMMLVIKKLYPDYYGTAKAYFEDNKCSPYNMFITSNSIMDNYCQWLFSIFNEMERYVKLSSYSRAARLYGYLAENLLSIYCIHNKLKIKYIREIVNGESVNYNWLKNSLINLQFRIKHFVYHKILHKEDYIFSEGSSYMIGLMNDGIDIH